MVIQWDSLRDNSNQCSGNYPPLKCYETIAYLHVCPELNVL